MPIFAVKITARQEQTVIGMITTKESEQTHAALAPDSLTNYVMIEADDDGVVACVLEEILRACGPVESGGVADTSSMAEVGHFLPPTSGAEGIAEGDIAEPIAGPLKGEKARVQHTDEVRNQVTVELYETTAPIPVIVYDDQIRVLDSGER